MGKSVLTIALGVLMAALVFYALYAAATQSLYVSGGILAVVAIASRVSNFSLQTREAIASITNLFTKNNVPVTIEVAVQYFVKDKGESIRDAFFKLSNPGSQIQSYVNTAVRTRAAKYNFDELNEKQLEIA